MLCYRIPLCIQVLPRSLSALPLEDAVQYAEYRIANANYPEYLFSAGKMSIYDYSAVLYDGGWLKVDGCSCYCTASYSILGSAFAEAYTLQSCVANPMISQALSVVG